MKKDVEIIINYKPTLVDTKENKMKLSKLLKEDIEKNKEEEKPALTNEQKKQFLETVKSFGKYGKHLKTEVDLVQLSEELNGLCQMAEQVILSEADEWFDKITINRNMKDLKRIGEEFSKASKEAKSLQERMLSLYEDMGHVLNRYFEVTNDDNLMKQPVINETEDGIVKGTKFNYNDITWIVTNPGITQSRVQAITQSIKGKTGIVDNKTILKNKILENISKKSINQVFHR